MWAGPSACPDRRVHSPLRTADRWYRPAFVGRCLASPGVTPTASEQLEIGPKVTCGATAIPVLLVHGAPPNHPCPVGRSVAAGGTHSSRKVLCFRPRSQRPGRYIRGRSDIADRSRDLLDSMSASIARLSSVHRTPRHLAARDSVGSHGPAGADAGRQVVDAAAWQTACPKAHVAAPAGALTGAAAVCRTSPRSPPAPQHLRGRPHDGGRLPDPCGGWLVVSPLRAFGRRCNRHGWRHDARLDCHASAAFPAARQCDARAVARIARGSDTDGFGSAVTVGDACADVVGRAARRCVQAGRL